MGQTTGFLYIATGDEFVEEAILSARTIEEHHPDVPICLFTDTSITDPIFDHVQVIDTPKYGFEDQINYLEKTPFDRTIYLDTDIYADGSVTSVFDVLDEFDIALVHSQSREAWSVPEVPDAFPEYNSGVMAYELTDRFQNFLATWQNIYQSNKNTNGTMRNQPSLRKALYESDIRIATLTPEYNCMFRYPGHAVGPVKLFHGRLQPVDGPGAGEYFDAETAVNIINQTDEPRVFTQLGGITLHTNKVDSLFHRARLSYRKHGLKHVLREGVKLLVGDSSNRW
jgi:hypothetical protein